MEWLEIWNEAEDLIATLRPNNHMAFHHFDELARNNAPLVIVAVGNVGLVITPKFAHVRRGVNGILFDRVDEDAYKLWAIRCENVELGNGKVTKRSEA